MAKKKSKTDPAQGFADIFSEFGNAVAEIFNDPKLKKEINNFSKSAGNSAKILRDRFKDEEVRDKFKKTGKAAIKFGKQMEEKGKEYGKKGAKVGKKVGKIGKDIGKVVRENLKD